MANKKKIFIKVGDKFDRWTVTGYAGPMFGGHPYWFVTCDCGKKWRASASNLINKLTRSCGCLAVDESRKRFTTHGMVKSREWKAWSLMKTRCSNPRRNTANRYIGRGIKVCKRWLHSFENFLADMGKCPPGFTLDRIDNDGDYTPKNCRWADMTQQARNKSCNRLFTFEGQTKCMQEWSQDKRCQVGFWGFRTRLDLGWTIEEALLVKKNTKIRYYRERA